MVQQCYIRRLGGDVVLLLLLLLPGLVLLSSSPDTQRVVVGNTTLHSEVCLYVYVYTWAKIYICVCVEHVHTYVCDWCAPGYIFQLQLETMYNSTREREREKVTTIPRTSCRGCEGSHNATASLLNGFPYPLSMFFCDPLHSALSPFDLVLCMCRYCRFVTIQYTV